MKRSKWQCHSFLLLLIVLLFLTTGCSGNATDTAAEQYNRQAGMSQTAVTETKNEFIKNASVVSEVPEAVAETDSSELNVYFIDVGQADACLLESGGHFMLIDAGDNDDEQFIVEYLQGQNVNTLDYVVGTHPHADHIGGLDAVINQFEIENLYLPKVMNNTKTFEDVLTAIEKKGMMVTTPIPGNEFYLNEIPVQILAPVQPYSDLNNNSIVLKVTDGEISFLFTGDAEAEAETDILKSDSDLLATVLKVGHHGSSTSSSQPFVEAVKPQYAVISVGTNNSYGHPDETVLKRLQDAEAEIFRTDQNGTIHFSTDGKELEIICEDTAIPETIPQEPLEKSSSVSEPLPENIVNTEDSVEITYIGNVNTKKFHLPSCNTLPANKNRIFFIDRNKAIEEGYVPCKKCNP